MLYDQKIYHTLQIIPWLTLWTNVTKVSIVSKLYNPNSKVSIYTKLDCYSEMYSASTFNWVLKNSKLYQAFSKIYFQKDIKKYIPKLHHIDYVYLSNNCLLLNGLYIGMFTY